VSTVDATLRWREFHRAGSPTVLIASEKTIVTRNTP